MNLKTLSLAVLLALPLAAPADPKPGTDTRAWTDLQKSGKAASRQPRPVPGEVADKTYERYVKSFERPIPETYVRENISSGDSGGGNSK
jgi:hypothetical protein